MDINVRVEFEPTPIRHIAVQCPNCKKWFRGYDITSDKLCFDYQLEFAKFHCPVCRKDFSFHDNNNDSWSQRNNFVIYELPYEEVYKDCLTKKEVWE